MIHTTPPVAPLITLNPQESTPFHHTTGALLPPAETHIPHIQFLTPVAPWVFSPAQVEMHSPPAPYAWGILHTKSSSAMHPQHRTASTRPLPNIFEENSSVARTINHSVQTGSKTRLHQQTTQQAAPLFRMRSARPWSPNVSSSSESVRCSPYKPDVWECLLIQAGLIPQYQHIPNSM